MKSRGKNPFRKRWKWPWQTWPQTGKNSINSSDLAKELSETICESFVLEIIKARAIENVLYRLGGMDFGMDESDEE
jgi:hypothetical protein